MIIDTREIPGLGKLKHVETYAYYDEPVLYCCQNAAGHLYLVVAAAANEQGEIWLFTGVSDTRLARIRSGAIDLHDAFADPENGSLLQVTDPYNENTEVEIVPIQPNQIPQDMLPMPDERLNLKTETLPKLRDPKEFAVSSRQDTLTMSLNFPGIPRTEAPIAALSLIFKGLQDVLNTIGTIQAKAQRMSEQIKKSMQVSLLEVGAGSFEVRLASTELVEIFGESKFGESIDELLKLLEAGNDQDQLKALLDTAKSRVLNDYITFLKTLSGSIIDGSITWTSPHPDRGGRASLSKSKIQEVLVTLQEYQDETPFIFEITGMLTAVHLRKRTFEIETIEEGRYNGTISEDAIDAVRTATLSREYNAEIQEITTRSTTTNETTTKHKLLRLW